jgi:hypothetical protein
LPVATIFDFLGIDPETVKRQLEDDLFTVNDSKFNELLSNLYGALSETLVKETDLSKRVSQGLGLIEKEKNGADQLEGSGEGM